MVVTVTGWGVDPMYTTENSSNFSSNVLRLQWSFSPSFECQKARMQTKLQERCEKMQAFGGCCNCFYFHPENWGNAPI